MPKTCKHDNCTMPVFSKGDCRYHAGIRYQKAYRKKQKAKAIQGEIKPIKRKAISKVPTRKHTEKKSAERVAMQAAWNLAVKDFGTHKAAPCACCGAHIHQLEPINAAHIVSKGAMPQARCDIENIVIVCKECHQAMDFQDSKGRTRQDLLAGFAEWLNAITIKMKKRYNSNQ